MQIEILIIYNKRPIEDDDDVKGMFIVITQSLLTITIEMYLGTSPKDHQSMPIDYTRPMQIVEENISPMGYDSRVSPRH